jgi:DNA-binding CsgD family transcriptional regulator
MGVIAVDRHARILSANRQARTILEHGDGLRIFRARVAAARERETATLHRLIADACGRDAQQTPHRALRVSRGDGRPPLALGVVGLQTAEAEGARTAAIFVSDPASTIEPGSEVLRQLYGMTPAEIRIATLLIQGARVTAIAHRLRITTNTTRTHLKRLFAKTEARSQSDLLRILLTGPALLRDGRSARP